MLFHALDLLELELDRRRPPEDRIRHFHRLFSWRAASSRNVCRMRRNDPSRLKEQVRLSFVVTYYDRASSSRSSRLRVRQKGRRFRTGLAEPEDGS
jgi:hypothetical protein